MKHIHGFRAISILLFLCFNALSSFSQEYTISGKVTDAQNRQPLAFVNIVINEGAQGCMSDIDGKYSITSPEAIKSIRFSYIGYETLECEVVPSAKKLNVTLTPKSFELQEITVDAGENPAHRIIDSVMAHRKQNNPDNLGSYSYKIYDKMVFTIDSSQFKAAQAVDTMPKSTITYFDSILRKNDLMVMETASEVMFKSPDNKRKNVLGTKIAGMKDPTFIYLVDEMQSISFYDEMVNITGTKYVNPLSRGCKEKYFFTLESTTPIGGNDSLYVISFHPYRGTNFDGLCGSMTINSNDWALQSVKASPNEQGGVFRVSIQQLYHQVDGQWFPKQLNTNLVFPAMGINLDGQFFPMVAVGKSYLSEIQINPEISRKLFSEIEVNVDRDAGYRDDNFWTAQRIDSLNLRTQATYAFLDSLTRDNNILDKMLGMTDEILEEGGIPIGKIDLDISKIAKLSEMKGFYLGLGFATNNNFSRIAKLNAYAGYWMRFKDWDYGGGVKFNLNRQKQMTLGLNFYNRSDAMGEFHDLQDSYDMIAEANYKYTFYENINVRQNACELEYDTRFARHFKGFFKFSSINKHYLKQIDFPFADTINNAIFAIAEARLRFAYNEKFVSDVNGIRSLGTTYPIAWLSYQHGFKGILGSQDQFERIKFEVSKNIYTRFYGVSQITLQAGWASESCPIMETFNILGSYSRFGLYSPNSFNAMREDEFFCDRFVALYLSHNFSGMLWQPNSFWFKPQLVLITNMAWGDMKQAHGRQIMDYSTQRLVHTMDKGYFESGIVVRGIIDMSMVQMGLGVFYRYGAYSFPDVWQNFALKWTGSISL